MFPKNGDPLTYNNVTHIGMHVFHISAVQLPNLVSILLSVAS